MQKITPFLWFDKEAEEAAKFYTSIFKDSKIHSVNRMEDVPGGPASNVITVSFELDGLQFTAMNAGPQFSFTHAISFFVACDTQEEVDYLWSRLTEGGQEEQCGWLKDKFGLSWQIVPKVLGELMSDPDLAKARRVTEAMLKMVKLDIPTLRRAYEGA
jgi:predicted 3-demethylubiquinone-9 3-methyltransferase (glyoxalase superfamily)